MRADPLTRRPDGVVWAPSVAQLQLLVADAEGRWTERSIEPGDDGWWSPTTPLAPGTRYRFVVDGEPLPDPGARWLLARTAIDGADGLAVDGHAGAADALEDDAGVPRGAQGRRLVRVLDDLAGDDARLARAARAVLAAVGQHHALLEGGF